MNKSKFIDLLLNETNYNEEQVNIITEILDEHFIVGRKNKEKMVSDFISKLNISDLDADKLYNTCMGIIMNNVKEKIKHPFKKDE